MHKLNMTRDQLYHYSKVFNVPKLKEGKYVKFSKKKLEEVQRLGKTSCGIGVLKRVSLFSCLNTELCISDILNLTWDKIDLASDCGYWIRIKTIKT